MRKAKKKRSLVESSETLLVSELSNALKAIKRPSV